MAVSGQVEGVGQHGPGLFVVRVGICALFLDPNELASDAVLLGLEQVERNSSGVVCVEELLALPGQLDTLLLHLLSFACGGCLQGVEVLQDKLLDVISQLGGEGDGAVLVLDEFLDELDRHGLSPAVGHSSGTTGADEVGIFAAPPISGGGDHQPGPAAAAVDAAA